MNNKQNALTDYVEVNVRIGKFWGKYPQGRLHTEIYKWEDGVVVVKAEAYRNIDDLVPAATGYAYEKENSSFINKTSALENCETSAIGRALGILGFEIKKSVASREEVENAQVQQRAIKQPKAVAPDDEQLKQARVLYQQIKGTGDGFEKFMRDCESQGLTIEQTVEKMKAKLQQAEVTTHE